VLKLLPFFQREAPVPAKHEVRLISTEGHEKNSLSVIRPLVQELLWWKVYW
jgi:hypothetical protein